MPTRILPMRMLTVLLLIAAVPLAACATVKGAGKDVRSVGQAGEDAIHGT